MPTFAVGNETEHAFDGDRIRYHRTYLPTTRHIDWIYLMAEGGAVAERPNDIRSLRDERGHNASL